MGDVVNGLANVITAVALLVGALPLLLRAVRELGYVRAEVKGAAESAQEAARLAALLVEEKREHDR